MLRWLQVGTAATGLSVALLAAPAVANADEGGAPSGGRTTTKNADSARSTGAARARTNAPKTVSGRPATSNRPASTPTPRTSIEAATTTGTQPAAADPSVSADVAIPRTTASRTTTRMFPAQVSAPVTLRSILTEPLTWLGLDHLGGPKLPIPALPLPDLVEAAWVGTRRFHYTFFNSTPTVTAHPYTTDPDTGVVTGDLDATDADGDTVQFRVTKPPVHGSVTIDADGTYTYTPDPSYAHGGGVDSFTITVKDEVANPFHIHSLTQLTRALTGGLHLLRLTPAPNPFWHNEKVTIVLGAINHAPELTTAVGVADPTTGTRTITVTTTDPDGDPVTLTTSAPVHGTLTKNTDGTYTYSPATAFAHIGGTDTITFTATDSYGATAQTPVAVAVAAINHAPTLNAAVGPADIANGSSRLLVITVADPDNDGVSISLDPGTLHGTLIPLSANERTQLGIPPNAGAYRYRPSATFAHTGGTETITITATDPYGATAQTTIDIVVAPVNRPPTTSVNIGNANPTDGSRLLFTTTNDPENDPVTLTSTTPANGTLTRLTDQEKANLGITSSATVYRYTPTPVFAHIGGTDTITFTATDSYGAITNTPLTITTAPINHAPVVTVAVGAQSADGSRILIATLSDPDGEPTTMGAITAPGHGWLAPLTNAEKITIGINPSINAFRYTPQPAYAHAGGPESVVFRASDILGAVGATTVNFTVFPVNSAPTATVTVAGSDADGDSLTYSAPATTARGTVTIDPTTGAFVYTPNAAARQAVAGSTSGGTIT